MQTQAPDQIYGYNVVDSAGKKIGTVDGVWVDDATDQLEFVGVKTGWLMGKTHIIPAAQAQLDSGSGTITVPYAESQIKDAPSYGTDAELTPDDENNIYSYYGMDRSTAPSPTGLPTGDGEQTGTFGSTDTGRRDFTATDTGTRDFTAADAGTRDFADTDTGTRDFAAADTGTREYDTADTGERRVQLSEEELQVGKRQVEAGSVRLRKVVRTEQQEVPVELRREEIDIQRVPASGQDVPDSAFQEEEIEVPVRREEPVVGKEAHVTGEVRVGKDVQTETQSVGDQVRREDVEVDRDVDTNVDPNVRDRGLRS